MTELPESDLDRRRKRLKFRAWHRGTREMDLLLGSFTDRHITEFDDNALGTMEALMEVPDPDLYNWIIGADEPPAGFDTPILRQLREFHAHGGNAR